MSNSASNFHESRISERLEQAFSAEEFRKNGHAVVDMLADYLDLAQNGKRPQTFPGQCPEDSAKQWQDFAPTETTLEMFQKVLDDSVAVHDRRFMGHQINPPLPISSLSGLVADVLNNGMGVYEMGMPGNSMELAIAKMLGDRFGMPKSAGGFFTSGGSLGNLTAMLAARSCKSHPCNEPTQSKFAVMVSDQAHYCVERSVHIMGWGAEGIIKVPTDDQFRMRTDALGGLLAEAKSRGIQVVAVVGSVCSTSTGSYDDLESIGKFCQQNDLWFHVDAAHGGAAIFSKKYRSLLDGTKLADSIVLDFHKVLLSPAIATAVVFANSSDAYRTFSHKAEYLWANQDEEWYMLSKRTFECTKSMMALKVYSTLANDGIELLDDYVTLVHDLAKSFAAIIDQSDDFELAIQPESNILCFRYVSSENADYEPLGNDSVESGNRLNAELRQAVIDDGTFYIVQTNLRGKNYLRCTITNPFTTAETFESLLVQMRMLVVEKASSQSDG